MIKKQLSCAALLLAALVTGASPAFAVTIGFNDFPEGSSCCDYRGFIVTESGFQFENSFQNSGAYLQWSQISGYNADPIGHTLSHNYSNTTTTITKIGGGAFNFASIDLADVYNNANSGTGGQVDFQWTTLSTGVGSASVFLDTSPGLQTFSFNVPDVVDVRITPVTTFGPWLQFDNVVLDAEVSSAPAPIAGAGWLAWILFGGVAVRRRLSRMAEIMLGYPRAKIAIVG